MPVIDTPSFLVSTDLDGTLLDHHNYSWEAALPAIHYLQSQNIPIIFNTSKTLSEALVLQNKVDIEGPVIIENGSAIALPKIDAKKYLSEEPSLNFSEDNDHVVVTFGCDRQKILEFIEEQKHVHGKILEGYNDWTLETIANKTGLSIEEAKLSAEKRFSEPFIWLSDEKTLEEFILLAERKKLKILKGGRFFHLQGNTTKATPLNWLKSVFTSKNTQLQMICLGDNKNDIHMLNVADIPVCVKSPTSPYPAIEQTPSAIYTQGEGPVGWNEAISKIFSLNETKKI